MKIAWRKFEKPKIRPNTFKLLKSPKWWSTRKIKKERMSCSKTKSHWFPSLKTSSTDGSETTEKSTSMTTGTSIPSWSPEATIANSAFSRSSEWSRTILRYNFLYSLFNREALIWERRSLDIFLIFTPSTILSHTCWKRCTERWQQVCLSRAIRSSNTSRSLTTWASFSKEKSASTKKARMRREKK